MLPQEPFDFWNIIKKRLQFLPREPFFNEGEIWWCALGMNVGHEYNGKNQNFERPVLIILKINATTAWALPITTKIKDDASRLDLKGVGSQIALQHLRFISSRRLLRRIDIASPGLYVRVIELLVNMLEKAKLRRMAENLGDPDRI
jgi:mRNA interferase MazF